MLARQTGLVLVSEEEGKKSVLYNLFTAYCALDSVRGAFYASSRVI